MTSNNHPITPPPKLVQQWITKYGNSEDPRWQDYEQDISTQAANWGWQQRDASLADELQKARDEELEACCEWVSQWCCMVGDSRPEVGLRVARRPKPKSLAEEAIEALKAEDDAWPVKSSGKNERFDTVRRALQRLQELEGNQ